MLVYSMLPILQLLVLMKGKILRIKLSLPKVSEFVLVHINEHWRVINIPIVKIYRYANRFYICSI